MPRRRSSAGSARGPSSSVRRRPPARWRWSPFARPWNWKASSRAGGRVVYGGPGHRPAQGGAAPRPHRRTNAGRPPASCRLNWKRAPGRGSRKKTSSAGCILNAIAECCGVAERPTCRWRTGERLDETTATAPDAWRNLLLGATECIFEGRDQSRQPAPFCPARSTRCTPGTGTWPRSAGRFSVCRWRWKSRSLNVDKPPLDYIEIERRLAQFAAEQPVWLSRAATFDEKSRLFPCATFLVGTDTLRRIAEPRYYAGDAAACQAALERIAGRGCKFLVFGRDMGTGFVRLSDSICPRCCGASAAKCRSDAFRENVSSTAMRRAARGESSRHTPCAVRKQQAHLQCRLSQPRHAFVRGRHTECACYLSLARAVPLGYRNRFPPYPAQSAVHCLKGTTCIPPPTHRTH